jgi:hypothetical protein
MIVGIAQASNLLNARPEEVEYLASHGQLPARNVGGNWYFSDQNIESYKGTVRWYREEYGDQLDDFQAVVQAPQQPPAQD